MRLDRMLWHCLLPGATAHGDDATMVSLKPAADESVFFFKIDGPAFREGDAGMQVADLLVVARKAGIARAVMMYVELKGSRRNTSDAFDQLQSAIESIEPLLPDDCRRLRDAKVVIAFAKETPLPREWRLKREAEFRQRIRHVSGWKFSLAFRSAATFARPADLREQLPSEWR